MKDMERTGLIYGYKNKVTGKWYIGQTINPYKRYKAHYCKSTKGYFDSTLKAHSDEFEYYIIENDIDDSLLDEREDYWINQKNALWPNGYNLTTGGNRRKNLSDISRQKMSESHKGRITWMKGKHHSEETRQLIGERGKGRIPWNKGLNKNNNDIIAAYSKPCSEETKIKISAANKGRKLTLEVKKKMSKPVLQFDLDGNFIKEYWSAKEAAKEVLNTNNRDGHIGDCCNGKRLRVGGFTWKWKEEVA